MSRAFETKIPLLNSSDRTKNLKAKTVYSNMIKTANNCPLAGANYTGTLRFNSTGNMTNYRSYELANTMGLGAAFVWDNCCQGMSGTANDNKGIETWNSSGTIFDWADNNDTTASGHEGNAPLGFQYWIDPGLSGAVPPAPGTTGWMPDHLDNAGTSGAAGGTLDGSGVWIDPNNNLFGSITDCEIDLWKNFIQIQNVAAYTRANNTKKNYLIAYQQIGGNKNNVKPWSLKSDEFGSLPGSTGACCTGDPYEGIGTW